MSVQRSSSPPMSPRSLPGPSSSSTGVSTRHDRPLCVCSRRVSEQVSRSLTGPLSIPLEEDQMTEPFFTAVPNRIPYADGAQSPGDLSYSVYAPDRVVLG